MAKRKGRRGQKRKSYRTKALEALKKAKKVSNSSPSAEQERTQEISITCDQHNAAPSPPMAAAEGMEASSSRQSLPRRGRKKKRLDEVAVTSAGPTTQQNEEQAKLEVPPDINASVLPSKQQMPEKCLLEFILDILQRRDTHEIFAQPVDRNEVEGYYSIIEEPMDFGTMRAKLQEGIYTTLEQFERDVFLITNNAMLFNSSATIYFRQACAIHELAKRVFQTLKIDPQKIELEFSLTRKRYGRKPPCEYGGSRAKLGAKFRVSNLGYCGSVGANPFDNKILPGCQYGTNANFYKTERRQTYTPQYSTVSVEGSIVSTVYSSSKQLVPGNGGIGYKESLLWFVKDLGPIAQKVACQNLKCSTQIPFPLISFTASQPPPPTCINGVMNNVTAAVNNPQVSHVTVSNCTNIIIDDSTGIDSSTYRGGMELGTDGPDSLSAVSKGKSILIAGGMVSYGGKETIPCNGNDGLNSSNDTHSASMPQPGLFEFLSSSNRRPKSSVYPSTVIKPSGSSLPSTLMHGLTRESSAPLDLNCGASSSPVTQPVEWSRPTPWGPQAIDDFQGNLLGNTRFMQHEAKSSSKSLLGPDGFSRQQTESQVATAAPYAQLQPSGMTPLGRDAVLQQELLSQSAYTQPPPSLLNLLRQDIFVQPNLLGQDAYVLQGPQRAFPQYMQPQSSDVNPVGRNGLLSREVQSGLPHQGLMSDPRYINERDLIPTKQ